MQFSALFIIAMKHLLQTTFFYSGKDFILASLHKWHAGKKFPGYEMDYLGDTQYILWSMDPDKGFSDVSEEK